MTEAEALLKIAEAINHLADQFVQIGLLGFLFLFFKNMGTSSGAIEKIVNAIESLNK